MYGRTRSLEKPVHPGARPTNRLEQKEKAQIGIFGRFFSEKCRTNEKSP
jgi:hypothetical protein